MTCFVFKFWLLAIGYDDVALRNAASSLLQLTCDAVLELDAHLELVDDNPNLTTLLLLGNLRWWKANSLGNGWWSWIPLGNQMVDEQTPVFTRICDLLPSGCYMRLHCMCSFCMIVWHWLYDMESHDCMVYSSVIVNEHIWIVLEQSRTLYCIIFCFFIYIYLFV